jgi:hypothetical protein
MKVITRIFNFWLTQVVLLFVVVRMFVASIVILYAREKFFLVAAPFCWEVLMLYTILLDGICSYLYLRRYRREPHNPNYRRRKRLLWLCGFIPALFSMLLTVVFPGSLESRPSDFLALFLRVAVFLVVAVVYCLKNGNARTDIWPYAHLLVVSIAVPLLPVGIFNLDMHPANVALQGGVVITFLLGQYVAPLLLALKRLCLWIWNQWHFRAFWNGRRMPRRIRKKGTCVALCCLSAVICGVCCGLI